MRRKCPLFLAFVTVILPFFAVFPQDAPIAPTAGMPEVFELYRVGSVLVMVAAALPDPEFPVPAITQAAGARNLSGRNAAVPGSYKLPEPFLAPTQPAAAAKAVAPSKVVAPSVKPATTAPAAAATKPATTAPVAAATKPATTAPAATKPTTTAPAAATAKPAPTAGDKAATSSTGKPVGSEPPKASAAVKDYGLPLLPASSSAAARDDSRNFQAEKAIGIGERFELRLPGSGWTYLGEKDGKEGIRYETRRFEGTEAVFAFSSERTGVFSLRFQRQDPVQDRREEYTLKVTASTGTQAPASSASARIQGGPAVATESTASATPAVDSLAVPDVTASTAEIPLPADPAGLLKRAKDELSANRVKGALDALDRYLRLFPLGSDEVHYLYGLAYEQNTPYRDIKKSYAAYKRVRDEFPRSARWEDAAAKCSYLERHYYELR